VKHSFAEPLVLVDEPLKSSFSLQAISYYMEFIHTWGEALTVVLIFFFPSVARTRHTYSAACSTAYISQRMETETNIRVSLLDADPHRIRFPTSARFQVAYEPEDA
jgi:hypothetical protein